MVQVRVHVVGHHVTIVVGRSGRIVLHVQVLLLLQMLQGIFGAEQRVRRHHQVVSVRQLGPVDRCRLQGDCRRRRWRSISQDHSAHVGRNRVAAVLLRSPTATAASHRERQAHHLLCAKRRIPRETGSAW